jgi:hypothetical protein
MLLVELNFLKIECFLAAALIGTPVDLRSVAPWIGPTREETFSAPAEWATFIKQGKAKGTIEEAMVYLTTDTTLEVRRKTRLDDVVSLVAPGVEVQTDETWMLPE